MSDHPRDSSDFPHSQDSAPTPSSTTPATTVPPPSSSGPFGNWPETSSLFVPTSSSPFAPGHHDNWPQAQSNLPGLHPSSASSSFPTPHLFASSSTPAPYSSRPSIDRGPSYPHGLPSPSFPLQPSGELYALYIKSSSSTPEYDHLSSSASSSNSSPFFPDLLTGGGVVRDANVVVKLEHQHPPLDFYGDLSPTHKSPSQASNFPPHLLRTQSGSIKAKDSKKRSDDKKKNRQQALVDMLPESIPRKAGLANQLKQVEEYFVTTMEVKDAEIRSLKNENRMLKDRLQYYEPGRR